MALLFLPQSASHLLWAQDSPTGVWTLPYVRLDPTTPTPLAIARTLEQIGWESTRQNYQWVVHPAEGQDRLSLIFLSITDWTPSRPHLAHLRTSPYQAIFLLKWCAA